MIRFNDVILLVVVFTSMMVGIFFPRFGSLFRHYPQYGLMILLFLSFISIEITTIWAVLKNTLPQILCLTLLKIVLLPVVVYYVFTVIAPSYAVAALLLSGISTGVVAPFISNLVKGNSPLVMVLVVVTSLLIPFTLPALIEVLLGQSVDIPLAGMIRMLSLIIFVPIVVAEGLRKVAPGMLQAIMKVNYPLSLFLFAVIIMGIFSRYAEFFHREPLTIFTAAAVGILLGGVYCGVGILCMAKRSVADQLAGAITLGHMNNVLIIVFASRFFGPLEPTVAALYIFPFFGLLIPLRMYHGWYTQRGSGLPS